MSHSPSASALFAEPPSLPLVSSPESPADQQEEQDGDRQSIVPLRLRHHNVPPSRFVVEPRRPAAPKNGQALTAKYALRVFGPLLRRQERENLCSFAPDASIYFLGHLTAPADDCSGQRPRQGDVLNFRYEIIGSYSQRVFIAKDHKTRSPVTVKLYAAGDSGQRESFQRETEILEPSRYVLPITDTFSTPAYHGIVRPHQEANLRQFWSENADGTADEDDLLRVLARWFLRYLLAQCRRRLVHGDLTPERILMTRKGPLDAYTLSVVGFGQSCTLPISRSNEGKWPLASDDDYYRAPEVKQLKPYGCKADVYSVGMMLAELKLGCRFTEQELLGDNDDNKAKTARLGGGDFARFLLKFLDANAWQRGHPHDLLEDPWLDTAATTELSVRPTKAPSIVGRVKGASRPLIDIFKPLKRPTLSPERSPLESECRYAPKLNVEWSEEEEDDDDDGPVGPQYAPQTIGEGISTDYAIKNFRSQLAVHDQEELLKQSNDQMVYALSLNGAKPIDGQRQPPVGSVLGFRYEITDAITERTCCALDRQTGAKVTLKQFGKAGTQAVQFAKEKELIEKAAVDDQCYAENTNVVQLLDDFEFGDSSYLVWRHRDLNLRQYLFNEEKDPATGGLPLEVIHAVAKLLVPGLGIFQLRRRQIHGDLTPDHITVSRTGDNAGDIEINLVGLGQSCVKGQKTLGTRLRACLPARHWITDWPESSDVYYQAPEIKSRKHLGCRADVYSLGLILAELKLGRQFTADELRDRTTMRELLGGKFSRFSHFIMRCTEPDPKDRADALELERGKWLTRPSSQADSNIKGFKHAVDKHLKKRFKRSKNKDSTLLLDRHPSKQGSLVERAANKVGKAGNVVGRFMLQDVRDLF